nr:hypothetical protein [Bacteroidota bacterium]
MKNSILFLIAFSLIMISCKKENTDTPEMGNPENNVETLILNFKNKLENHLKDGTVYSADSAVWYVEALLNYTYGFATAQYCTFENDSVDIILNTNGNNGYSIQELAEVYEYLEENVLANKPEGTYIFAIDVSLTVNNNTTTFYAGTGYAKQLFSNFKSAEDTSGYWFWGEMLGMCGPDYGLYVGTDASDIIEALVNSTADYEYFTNIEFHLVFHTSYYDSNFPFTSSDPTLLPYRLFANQDTIDFCLSPTHINYYSGNNGALYVVRDKKPANREFAYCNFGTATMVPNTDIHVIGIFYGSPNEGQ